MAKVCSNCGTPIQDGVKFCGKCGQKVPVEQTTEPQQNQAALEKFSALSPKNKAICVAMVAVVVIALFVVFGGNLKTSNPQNQSKYLGMDVQTFVDDYNASLNSKWIKKLSGDASVNRNELRIIGIEQQSDGATRFKLNGAPIEWFNGYTADGYLTQINLKAEQSNNSAAFIVIVNNIFSVMENHQKLNFDRVNGELVRHLNNRFKIQDNGVNVAYWNDPVAGYFIRFEDAGYYRGDPGR